MQQSIRRTERRRGPEVDSLILFTSAYNFAKTHYLLTFTYILGLLVVQFATGFTVSPVQQLEFQDILGKIDIGAFENAKEQAFLDYEQYRASKGWFFTCDEQCMTLYHQSQESAKQLQRHEDAYALALSDARSKVGVFSEFAVEDARETWWDAFHRGVQFAKRMSYFDALSLAISSMRRDDSLASVVFQWLLQVVVNFFIGMVSALVSFMVHVGSLIVSYQAHPLSGISFFLLASSGAFAVVASFVVGAYFVVASGTFVALQVSGGRIAFQQEERRRMRAD